MALRTPFHRHGVALLLLVAASVPMSRARAQGSEPPATITLDRMDTRTRLGLQFGFQSVDSPHLGDGFVMRFEPYGQYVFSGHVVGLYGALPLAHDFDFDPDATGVGNLDLGLFFLPMRTTDLILRIGVALPTASTDGPEQYANLLASNERLTDRVLAFAHYTAVRLSLSTVQGAGRFFFRGDVGLDLAADKPAGPHATVWGHLNAAGGVRFPALDLSAELVSFGTLHGDTDDLPGLPYLDRPFHDRFLHTLTFGLCTRGRNQLHLGLVLPVDDYLRGDVWIISVGYQYVTR
jgi:hypothetical protein